MLIALELLLIHHTPHTPHHTHTHTPHTHTPHTHTHTTHTHHTHHHTHTHTHTHHTGWRNVHWGCERRCVGVARSGALPGSGRGSHWSCVRHVHYTRGWAPSLSWQREKVINIILTYLLLFCVYSDEGGVKLWDVDMNRSRTFPLGPKGGVVRAVFRSKVSCLV